MKYMVRDIIDEALGTIIDNEQILQNLSYQVNYSKSQEHGDFATNVALILAKKLKRSPMEIANDIKKAIPINPTIEKIEIAGPGFINFFFSKVVYTKSIEQVLSKEETYGISTMGNGKSIHLEFVSVNPTGPLHVGHGRNAIFGAALASCLEAAGYKVLREYYVNDAGRQMDILAVSVWLRYLELHGEIIKFPANGYQGGYVFDIASGLIEKHKKEFFHKAIDVLDKLPPDEIEGGDKEKYIDALITRSRMLLGEESYWAIHQYALRDVLADIRSDLESFGIYQEWFSEQSLLDQNAVEDAIDILKRNECMYEKDHALWFNSSKFGDDKDRVLVRANGQYTYFATDIANHYHKYLKEYCQIIDIWGADHHGYIARMRAAIEALGLDVNKFHVLLVQFATLYRGDEKVQMSTRSGSFITLKELHEEVGTDATKFFYIMRKQEQHMDFDIDLAKSKTAENPVYYIQYAHARICSVFRQLTEKKLKFDRKLGMINLGSLDNDHEVELMKMMMKYSEVIEQTANAYSPHILAQYLKELATAFHTYYNASTFLVEDEIIRNARLCLIKSVKQVLKNGFTILGITTPDTM